MVLHCLLVVAKGVIILAEIAIATSFSCPVADFLSNALVVLVLRKCLLVIAWEVIIIAEIAIGNSFSGPVADCTDAPSSILLLLYFVFKLLENF